MVNCPHCGHPNDDDADFCTECGERIDRRRASPGALAPRSQAASPRAQPSGITLSLRHLAIGGAAIAVLAVAVIGLKVASGGSSHANSSRAAGDGNVAVPHLPVQSSLPPSLTPIPNAAVTARPSFGVTSQNAACRKSPDDAGEVVSTLQPLTVLQFDLTNQVNGVSWYRTSDQQCWVRAKAEDGLPIFPTRDAAVAAEIQLAPVGTVVYQADWSQGGGSWPQTNGWRVLNGMLVNDASNGDGHVWIKAPFSPSSVGLHDYAVEAEIQLVRGGGGFNSFGLVARDNWRFVIADPGGDKRITISWNGDEIIAVTPFDCGASWHTYRAEVKGNNLTFLIDGATMLTTTDNRVGGAGAGVYDMKNQVVIRSFKIIKL